MDQTSLSSGEGRPIQLAENNEPATRIELFPIGLISLRHRNGMQGPVIAKVTDAEALIRASMERAAAGMMPIDFDHGLDDGGTKDGRAAGWITALEVEGDKIVATVEWTVAGREALEQKLYRFISPVFYTSQENNEVTHLARAGLTNFPALPELKQVASAPETPLDGLCRSLASALGLKAEATTDEIVAGLLSRRSGDPATPATAPGTDEANSVPLEVVANYLAEQRKQDDAKTAAAMIDKAMHDGRLPPALRAWGVDLYQADPTLFDRFMASSPFELGGGPILTGKPPAAQTPQLATGGDHRAAICAQLNLAPDALDD